jgi:hypothetical protein
VVIGGLAASTFVTLFLIPCLYVTANDRSARAGEAIRIVRRETPAPYPS